MTRQRRVTCVDLGQEVGHRPRHAVALGLTGYNARVETEQMVDEGGVCRGDGTTVQIVENLGAEDRIVLGQWMVSLDLEARRLRAGDGVHEHRLLHCGHERVPDSAQHGVIGPDHQGVASLGKALDVMQRVRLQARRVGDRQPRRHRRVDLPPAGLDVVHGDHGLAAHGGLAVGVQPEQRVEDLHRHVRVQGDDDLADPVGVLVDELTQADAVVDGAPPRRSPDEQLVVGQAEGILAVDEQERSPMRVFSGGVHVGGGGPGSGLGVARRA